MTTESSRRPLLPTGVLLFLATLVVFLAGARNGGSGDTIPAQLLPISILVEGNLDFNEFVCPMDPETHVPSDYVTGLCTTPLPYYLDLVDGRVVSHFPIIPGLLNLPVHVVAYLLQVDLAARYSFLALLTSALIASASVVLIFLLLTELCRERTTAILGALVYAFGTLVWSVTSRGLWQHGPSLLFITAALYLLVRKKESGIPWAGLLLGFAVFNRPPNVLIAIPLALFVLVHHRAQFVRFCLFAAIPAAGLLLYSKFVLGSMMTLGQGQQMRFSPHPFANIAGLLVSPARGIFVFSPIFLLSLPYVPQAVRGRDRHPLIPYLLAGTLALICLYAAWPIWWGGHSFGYRLLSETIPAFIVLLALGWEATIVGSRTWRVAAAVLLSLSVYFNYLGARVGPCGFDATPNSIDAHPERLWQLRDTELIRCTRALGSALGVGGAE
ncbi:MAG: glycosyltransferase family 39 protein [Gemmatimonadota bacterium]|nr:glycosyltransferase family 39 protein [Gemmatimonadota bacterium]